MPELQSLSNTGTALEATIAGLPKPTSSFIFKTTSGAEAEPATRKSFERPEIHLAVGGGLVIDVKYNAGAAERAGDKQQLAAPWILGLQAQHLVVLEAAPVKDRIAPAWTLGLRARLLSTLETEPVEDGVYHAAEELLGHALRRDRGVAIRWIQDLWLEFSNKPELAAALLRCAGRLNCGELGTICETLAVAGLQHTDSGVREAAVAAIERWGNHELVEILRRHREREAWLADYIAQVVEDLS